MISAVLHAYCFDIGGDGDGDGDDCHDVCGDCHDCHDDGGDCHDHCCGHDDDSHGCHGPLNADRA